MGWWWCKVKCCSLGSFKNGLQQKYTSFPEIFIFFANINFGPYYMIFLLFHHCKRHTLYILTFLFLHIHYLGATYQLGVTLKIKFIKIIFRGGGAPSDLHTGSSLQSQSCPLVLFCVSSPPAL